ncbi:MAG: hypothetical protein KGS72_25290 [Cyanobacteria bacterium REEB67]|nr:hypothetical protein [Cyanobacteria bacterium REEB67]
MQKNSPSPNILTLSSAVLLTVGLTLSASFQAESAQAADKAGTKLSSGAAVTVNGAAPGSSSSDAMANAVNLYKQRQFEASKQAFEALMSTAPPSPYLYYYAAVANRESNHPNRARQLFEYIAKNFPQSREGISAQSIISGGTATASATPAASTPASGAATVSALAPTMVEKKRVKGAKVFSEDEIAREGANGIAQSGYPNCWFQASMSSLASLPRGQRLLSNMIHYGDGDTYVVRFPGDGVEYVVSETDCAKYQIHNGALWASLLECAQLKKFPQNRGANGEDGSASRLDIGMGCITGCKAEILNPKESNVSGISSFVGGAVRSQNPIIASTYDPMRLGNVPQLTVGPHAYTVIGIDQSRNMIILRNPHGKHSQRFSLADDPQHLKFEQMDDGVLKMNIEIFPTYFYSLARSFI